MYYTRKFITYFVANVIVMYAASTFASNFVVFGRLEIGAFQALLTAAFGITLAAMFVDILLKDLDIRIEPDKYLMLELLVNMGALYLLARTPLQNSVGVGIKAFWVAILIGMALSLAQYLAKTVTDIKK